MGDWEYSVDKITSILAEHDPIFYAGTVAKLTGSKEEFYRDDAEDLIEKIEGVTDVKELQGIIYQNFVQRYEYSLVIDDEKTFFDELGEKDVREYKWEHKLIGYAGKLEDYEPIARDILKINE